jgi:hypothetical protein
MVMDRATLLGHREHWTAEPSPTATALSRLDRAESALYADLISNAYAPSVRLEQERIRFSAVEKAVASSLMEPAVDRCWARGRGDWWRRFQREPCAFARGCLSSARSILK